MKLLSSFIIAFSMYSTIPMPRLEWDKESMKYAMCFFPLVGAVTGGILGLWMWVSMAAGIGNVLFAAVAVILPVLLSGAIHMDGFCDTVDALSSNQPMERKLEILKDSHTGAFAIIRSALYFLFSFGLWSELEPGLPAMLALGVGFVLSRSLSGYSVVSFRCAKNSGLLHTFSDAAAKGRVRVVMALWILGCAAALLAAAGPFFGGAVFVSSGLTFLYYRLVSYRQFGGVTGDLAGYFLQICELVMLLAVVAVQKLI